MTETVAPEPTPEQAALFARVRRMMLIAGLTTALAVAAVLIAIGYRLFRTEGSAVATDTTAMLPKGARIVATGVAGDRLVVTLDIGGVTEIRTFDARSAEARRPAEIRQRTLTSPLTRLAAGGFRGYSLRPSRSLRLAVRTRPSQGETGVRFP